MDYSPFNYAVWVIFVAFCVGTWLTVKAFQARHPDYPGYEAKEDGER